VAVVFESVGRHLRHPEKPSFPKTTTPDKVYTTAKDRIASPPSSATHKDVRLR